MSEHQTQELPASDSMVLESSSGTMYRSISHAVISLLTVNQIDSLIETFHKLDVNQDGVVDANEIMSMLETTFPNIERNVSEELCDVILTAADRNRDGAIDLKEYLISISMDQGVLPTEVEIVEDAQIDSIMDNLTSEEIDMFRDTFIRLDRNGDGYVDRSEMMQAVQAVVGDRFESLKIYLDKIYDVADKDVDGKLNLTEFLASFAEGPGVVPHEVVLESVQSIRIRLSDDDIAMLQEAFNTFDRNGDGYIDATELKEALQCSTVVRKNPDITSTQIDDLVNLALRKADYDQDEKLNLAEFIRSYQEDQQVLPDIFAITAVQRIQNTLSVDEIEFLRDAFMELDENGDGSLDESELTNSLTTTLTQVMKSDEVSNYIRLIIASADRNSDGKLSLSEFIEAFASGSSALDIPLIVAGNRIQAAMDELKDELLEDELRKLANVFDVLDQNQNGYLDFNELSSIIATLLEERYPVWTPDHMQRVTASIISAADTDQDGRLSLSEFIRSFYEGQGVLPEDFVEEVADAIDYAEIIEMDTTEIEQKQKGVTDSMPRCPSRSTEQTPHTVSNESQTEISTSKMPISSHTYMQEEVVAPHTSISQTQESIDASIPCTAVAQKNSNIPTTGTMQHMLDFNQGGPSHAVLFPNDVTGCPISHPQLCELFVQYDTDQTGALDRDEFKKVYCTFEHYGLMPTEREIDDLFRKYDTRHDGKIDFNEFAIIMLQRSRM